MGSKKGMIGFQSKFFGKPMKETLKLISYVKPYWKRSLLALVLLTAVVFMDLSIPRLVQRIIDEGITAQDQNVVIQTSLIMLAISILSTLFSIGNNIFSVQVAESVARDIRDAIFTHIQSFSYGNIDHLTTGRLLVRLTSDTSAFQRLVLITLRIGTRAPMLIIGSVLLMFNTNRPLTVSILLVMMVTSAIIIFFMLKMEPLYRLVQQKLDMLNTALQENIAGARLVKAFARGSFEIERFELANEDFTASSVRVMQFMSSMGPILTSFVNIGLALVIWVGGQQVIAGAMTTGQIVAFTNYLLTTMGPLILMTALSNVWAGGVASSKRIAEVLDAMPEVKDAPNATMLSASVFGDVVFDQVGFSYDLEKNHSVLESISFSAEAGQTVAFLGATGSGKSTLVNLIPRFYDPTAGHVQLDGSDLRALSKDGVLSQVGIVPQETVLFSGTVADNIRFGRPDAPMEAVIAAAQAAQAHDFITALPDGYESRVGQRGVNFSGGQKQRLAIARALLMEPRILILDDSTSSVDVETETKIQDALSSKLNRHTSFVVAQRISTVLNADKIIVVDKGRIAAEGTHRELMETSTIYREIYESQLGNGFTLNGLRERGNA